MTRGYPYIRNVAAHGHRWMLMEAYKAGINAWREAMEATGDTRQARKAVYAAIRAYCEEKRVSGADELAEIVVRAMENGDETANTTRA